MKSNNNNIRAIVRDPGTIFISWEKSMHPESYRSWKLIAEDLTNGQKIAAELDPGAGKHYLHSLTPDTSYNLKIIASPLNGISYIVVDYGTLPHAEEPNQQPRRLRPKVENRLGVTPPPDKY